MKFLKSLYWKCFTEIDAVLKFPNLKKGDIGIQCGFDMDAPVTSDLFLMNKRVKNDGIVYGIDPNPSNIEIADRIIKKTTKNITTIRAALSDKVEETELLYADKTGSNQTSNIIIDPTVVFRGMKIKVPVYTLADIVKIYNIPFGTVRHINLTINGSEYKALLGMEDLLRSAKDLSLTVIAGRGGKIGKIEGRDDHDLIMELLERNGFETKFKRINQLFWWGFIVKLIMQQELIRGEKNYGVIFAAKGKCKLKWFQSFS